MLLQRLFPPHRKREAIKRFYNYFGAMNQALHSQTRLQFSKLELPRKTMKNICLVPLPFFSLCFKKQNFYMKQYRKRQWIACNSYIHYICWAKKKNKNLETTSFFSMIFVIHYSAEVYYYKLTNHDDFFIWNQCFNKIRSEKKGGNDAK